MDKRHTRSAENSAERDRPGLSGTGDVVKQVVPETKEWNNEYLSSDIVLDIHDIQKYGQKLGNYVTRDTIQNGIHDLILSEKDSRDHVYRTVFDWLPGK